MNRIVVVDFDGCLCSINSFRFWLIFTSLYFLFTLRWISLFKFIGFVVLRVLGLSDRVKMKRDILSITENLPQIFVQIFCRILYLFINRKVVVEMQKYVGQQSNVFLVLCTAAPNCYIASFVTKFDFAAVFATASVFTSEWKENLGQEKLKSVEAYYGEDLIIDVVLTDHHDDLPLLLKAEKCVLVNPSKSTLVEITGRLDFELI